MVSILVSVLVVIVVLGLFVWAIKALVPMDPPFANAVTVIAILFVAIYCLWAILAIFGFVPMKPLFLHR